MKKIFTAIKIYCTAGYFNVLPTIIILVLLAGNHLVHGTGCWGFQPGGRLSALLYDIQVLLSGGMLILGVYMLFRNHDRMRFPIIGVTLLTAALAVYAFKTTGYRMYSSAHYQGIEKLPTFFLTSAVALIIGFYRIRLKRERLPKRKTGDRKKH